MNKFIFKIFGLLAFLLVPFLSFAAEPVTVDFFYSPTCPVCAQEHIFLDELADEYPQITINRFSVATREGYNKLAQFYQAYEVPDNERAGVPVTFIGQDSIGGRYLVGYGERVEPAVRDYINSLLSQLDSSGEDGNQVVDDSSSVLDDSNIRESIDIPLIGTFDVSGFSPLLLSVLMGGLDGFNACAMVALGFLLMISVSSGIRRRVFWIGGTFILVSGLVYFLFISAWLNLFIFLGYVKIIGVVMSLIIILFALFLLKDYFLGVVCKICDVKKDGKEGFLTQLQRKLLAKMNMMVASQMPLIVVLGGVAAVAVGVNLIELFCSFGFPLAYTKILVGYNLSGLTYYGYLLVYVLFYMLDDFLIFLIALITLRITKLGDKYLRAVKLISGILLLLLGLTMLINPDILTFK